MIIDQAIAKITKEAMTLNSPFATFIEEHLTEICTTTAVAEKLLAEDKRLEGFVKEQTDLMRAKAKQGGSGVQVAGASDAEFYAAAEKFYGIAEEDKQPALRAPQRAAAINVLDML